MPSPDDGTSSLQTRTASRQRLVPIIDDALRRATTRERELWFVVLFALTADVVLTYYGLQQGLTELNPLARTAIESIGAWTMVPLKAAAVGVGLACRPLLPDEYTGLIPVGLAVPWLVASGINATFIFATLTASL